MLGLAIAWVLFVPAADWLARHDVGSAKGSLLQTARDAARGRLLTLGAGLVAAAALAFTALNFNLLQRTYKQAEQGQVTDRYTKAIEQLGSSTIDVTIGGIYALERIAHDSPRDHSTVMEVLTACIREHSSEPLHEPIEGRSRPEPITRPDIQAAVTVIGRRDTAHDRTRINLSGVHLPGADLPKAKFSGADLAGANLTHSDLTGADLKGADLHNADLTGAKLTGADLTNADLREAVLVAVLSGAVLSGADLTYTDLRRADLTEATLSSARLTEARLHGADLTRATLTGSDLTGAKLTGANLTGADLTLADLSPTLTVIPDFLGGEDVRRIEVDLTEAKLHGANLTGAKLTDARLTGADLTDVRWPTDTPVPGGWKLDANSGQLKQVDTGAGPATTN
jgi:uncharacterized protein YjbI with pentapeptide repeats